MTLNALCAAQFILIPVQCEYYALEGLSDLLTTMRIVKRSLNPGLSLMGVILTMYDGRTNLSMQVAEEVKRHFPGKVYASVIPRNVRLSEAPSHGKPVMAYDPWSRGTDAYKALAEEIISARKCFTWNIKENTNRKEEHIMAFPERGLGRGLGALMGDDAYSEEQSGSLSTLPISQIQPGLKQPRKRFDDEAISELADSIREHGLIQPLTVRRLASGYYQIIAGERRWRASKEAGLTEVPVSIIEADDKKVMELGLIENLQREDLNPMEEANGYKASHGGIRHDPGGSRPADGQVPPRHCQCSAAAGFARRGAFPAGGGQALRGPRQGHPCRPAGEPQKKLAQKVVDEGLSVRETEALAKRLSKAADSQEDAVLKPVDPARESYLIHLNDLSKNLSQRLGHKVQFQEGAKKSQMVIEYYSLEDLDDLLNKIGVGGDSL